MSKRNNKKGSNSPSKGTPKKEGSQNNSPQKNTPSKNESFSKEEKTSILEGIKSIKDFMKKQKDKQKSNEKIEQETNNNYDNNPWRNYPNPHNEKIDDYNDDDDDDDDDYEDNKNAENEFDIFNTNDIEPNAYYNNSKEKLLGTPNINPKQFQLYLKAKAHVIASIPSHFASRLSNPAIFNMTQIGTAQYLFTNHLNKDGIILLISQLNTCLYESIFIASVYNSFEKGEEFFNETFIKFKGAISVHSFEKIKRKYLNNIPKPQICSKCGKLKLKGHSCSKKFFFGTSPNNNGNNNNNRNNNNSSNSSRRNNNNNPQNTNNGNSTQNNQNRQNNNNNNNPN